MKKGCESVSFFIYTHLCINLPKVLKINKEAATFETASFLLEETVIIFCHKMTNP